MSSGVSHILVFVHLGIILILVLGFYSGLSGRVRTVVVSLLFSRFTASALVWFSNFLKHLVGIPLNTVFRRKSTDVSVCI
jgi:hypothetical protein